MPQIHSVINEVNSPSQRYLSLIISLFRQVGNAVPPPMAKEIGREIKKCVHWKELQMRETKETKE